MKLKKAVAIIGWTVVIAIFVAITALCVPIITYFALGIELIGMANAGVVCALSAILAFIAWCVTSGVDYYFSVKTDTEEV